MQPRVVLLATGGEYGHSRRPREPGGGGGRARGGGQGPCAAAAGAGGRPLTLWNTWEQESSTCPRGDRALRCESVRAGRRADAVITETPSACKVSCVVSLKI